MLKKIFKKKENTKEQGTKTKDKKRSNTLEVGTRSVKDIIAPPSFDRSNEDFMRVGDKYVRSFVMNGYPSPISVGWLDDLYNYEGDMDTMLHIIPSDERTAIDDITKKITQYEAQLDSELRKGSIKNKSRLEFLIHDLYEQRSQLEQNVESLFQIQLACNLYSNSKEVLMKESQKLDNKIRGKRAYLMPVYLRQDDGYKSALPVGKSYMEDMFRNFNSGALTACFPFYGGTITHDSGVFCGVDIENDTPTFLDFYNRDKLINGNITVFGASGSGKTFFVSLLTMRSAFFGVRTTIIDPEGEYVQFTRAMGGKHIEISPNSDTRMNPFDLEDEEEEDYAGNIVTTVKIKEKVADLLNLIAVMTGGLNPEQRSIASDILLKVYNDFGFTDNPDSLYYQEPIFNEEDGTLRHNRVQKDMPTFSDFHKRLMEFAEETGNENIKNLGNSLKMFVKGGVYDLFDGHTTDNIKDFQDSVLVTFDVSKLEEGILRPIGMFIALSWTWEKFGKKNPHIKKRVVADEAWMLVSKSMKGYEYTASFLETTARRFRKQNGGLLVASQNFAEFADNPQGKAVLTNSTTKIFLRQDSTDIDNVQNAFKLSGGERDFLVNARRGQILLKIHNESATISVHPFDYEKNIIGKKKNKQELELMEKEKEKRIENSTLKKKGGFSLNE